MGVPSIITQEVIHKEREKERKREREASLLLFGKLQLWGWSVIPNPTWIKHCKQPTYGISQDIGVTPQTTEIFLSPHNNLDPQAENGR